jgi:hypothetical protein
MSKMTRIAILNEEFRACRDALRREWAEKWGEPHVPVFAVVEHQIKANETWGLPVDARAIYRIILKMRDDVELHPGMIVLSEHKNLADAFVACLRAEGENSDDIDAWARSNKLNV